MGFLPYKVVFICFNIFFSLQKSHKSHFWLKICITVHHRGQIVTFKNSPVEAVDEFFDLRGCFNSIQQFFSLQKRRKFHFQLNCDSRGFFTGVIISWDVWKIMTTTFWTTFVLLVIKYAFFISVLACCVWYTQGVP